MIALIQIFLILLVLPGGQLAQKGLFIYIPVDLNRQLSHLPPQCPEVGIVAISLSSSTGEYKEKPLPVNLKKIYNALAWLKENNHLYKNVTINQSNQAHLADSQEFCTAVKG